MTKPRTAKPGDAGALRVIWNTCFPGEEELTDSFLSRWYLPERALIIAEGDAPVSALYCFPRILDTGETVYPVHYLWAVATLPEFRGQGHASRLIRGSADIARREGAAALAIILESPGLLRFYERLGFVPVTPENPPPGPLGSQNRPAAEDDIPLLSALYGRRSGPKIRRDRDDWLGILYTYDVRVGPGSYAVSSDGAVLEMSDGHASSPAGCLLDLTADRALDGLTDVYMNLMFN
jgi:GNAT superfamily N-acetyltransferase